MTTKVKETHQSSVKEVSSTPNAGADKTAALRTSIGATQTQPPKPLEGRVTYTNPFVAFINFILSILNSLFGSSKEKAPEPVKTDPVVAKPVAVSEVKTSQSPSPAASTSIKTPAKAPVKAAVKTSQSPAPVASTSTKMTAPAPVKAEAVPTASRQASPASPARPESPKSSKAESTKESITQQYRNGLFEQLKAQYTAEEATNIFSSIYPAFNAGLQKELEKTVDLEKLKKPLKTLARTLIQEHSIYNQLEEIRAKLKEGRLALSRKAIFEQYPTLEKSLERMPTLKKKFETMLSKVWIEKELKKLSDYQSFSFERVVLKNLGYNTSSHDEKKFLKERLQASFSTDELPSLEDLPKAFRKQAFDIRAMAAGVPKEALSNLRKLLTFYSEELQKLNTAAKTTRDSLNVQCNSAASKAFIKSRFHQQNIEKINDHLIEFLKKNKSAIVKNLTSADFQNFLTSLPPLSKGLKISKSLEGSLTNAEAWFSKYEGMVVSEFSQGEDDVNECLSAGVCVGLSYRMASKALESPTDSTVSVAVTSIEPSDRIIQAHHMVKESIDLLPRKILAKKKQKEKPVFIAKGDVNVAVGLITHLQELKESNGGIMLGWADHETFMRFDPVRNKFFFFDPNFSTIVFRRRPDETLEELATRMAMAYIELYHWAYPDRDAMTAHQIVPLKDGEVPAEIDISKIPVYSN